MGFFSNIGVNAKVGVYVDVIKFLRNTDRTKFGFIDYGNGLYGSTNPVTNNHNKYIESCINDTKRQGTYDNCMWDENINLEGYEKYGVRNPYFTIEDDYTITFKRMVYLHKISASEIPFKLSEKNNVCIHQVKDDVFDWLPESLYSLWIHNACRTDKTLGFKNLKHVDHRLSVTGNNSITTLKGLETVHVAGCFDIKSCKKLQTTEGAPYIADNCNYQLADDRSIINIMSCPVLTTIDLPRSDGKRPVCIFINDKSCPSVNKVTALPSEVNFFACKNVKLTDIRNLSNTTCKTIEVSDYRGRCDVNIMSSSRDEQVEKLKEIIASVAHKGWQMFDDLYAVATYFGLLDYFTQESTRYNYKLEPSRYVENGMIHSYDPIGEVVRYGYHATGITRNNIKKGVCNYLNKIGARYEIINTDPKKKKEYEYIKVL